MSERLYTFYVCNADDIAMSREVASLSSDAEVPGFALSLLDQHPSATHVTAWEGDRRVHTRVRLDPDLRDLLSRNQ